MTTAEKIRLNRLVKGFSQENMADLLGLSTSAYGDIERGKSALTLPRLEKIAQHLGVPVLELLPSGDQTNNHFHGSHQHNVVAGTWTGNNHHASSEDRLRHLEQELDNLRRELQSTQQANRAA